MQMFNHIPTTDGFLTNTLIYTSKYFLYGIMHDIYYTQLQYLENQSWQLHRGDLSRRVHYRDGTTAYVQSLCHS